MMNLDIRHRDLFAPPFLSADRVAMRVDLENELELLANLFCLEWREATFSTRGRRHGLANDLMTIGGRSRLLDLAAALRLLGASPPTEAGGSWQIPLRGHLRHASQYEHAWSECLVGALLRPVGEVVWQPSRLRRGPRADYMVRHASGRFVVEVKRIRVGRTTQALCDQRQRECVGESGWLLTDVQQRQCEQRDIPRLYRRVRHAARQLAGSATAAHEHSVGADRIPGVLFLDVDANPYLLNLRAHLHRWMNTHAWARSIDGIVAFNYRGQDGRAGTVAEAIYERKGAHSHAALEAIFDAYPRCKLNQIHVAGLPDGPCTVPIGL